MDKAKDQNDRQNSSAVNIDLVSQLRKFLRKKVAFCLHSKWSNMCMTGDNSN